MGDFLKKLNRKTGFTMMEVLTGLTIISVVTSIVLPGIDSFYSSSRVKAQAATLVADMREARYNAMESQALHRIILHPDGGAYKIQAYAPQYDLDYTGGLIPTDPVNIDADAYAEYDNLEWVGIDEEEKLLDPGVEVYKGTASPLPDIIFFNPDGTLGYNCDGDNTYEPESDDNLPLPENYLTFIYGSSAIRVVINAFGVLSSEAYAPDFDYDFDNDNVLW
jgi:prepilin-type N-terminal cleavage/methylation domain-containing protein